MEETMNGTGLTRRGVLSAAGASLALAGIGSRARAQAALPNGTITLIVPFAAGGATDVVSRLVGKAFTERTRRVVVIESVGGAGGAVGATRLLRAAPDGTTLLMGTVATHAINPLMTKTPPYDPRTDFSPISLLASVPNVLLVNSGVKAKDVAELIALLKAEPGRYTYGSSVIGTPPHLSGELFKAMAGVRMEHVPYRGGGPAMNDLIGGQIPILFDVLSGAAGNIKGGSVRALAVTTKERSPSFPDVPTVSESGLPGYETYTWNAVFGPRGMAPDLAERLSKEFRQIVADDQIKARFAELSAIPAGSTPQELAKQVDVENEKWAPVVLSAGLKN
jgi:tripartite-type tricarboxylate transporter receptor subunit TctC